MKKNRKLSNWMLLASTGAFVCTGSGVLAGDSDANRRAEDVQGSRIYQTEETVEVRTDSQLNQQGAHLDSQIIDEPAGAERRIYTTERTAIGHTQSFGAVHKASDIIGMEVRNQQNEKLGDIKDVMVDLRSGRVPFAVISTEGMGDRLIAVPPSALHARAGRDELVLDMDRERLKSAPSFERNRWPNMSSQQWSSDVYRFYGAQPYWQTGSYQPYERRSEFHQESWVGEPAGATLYREESYLDEDDRFEDSNTLDDINKGSNTRGGAEDLQRFDEKANARRGVTSTWDKSTKGWHKETKSTQTHRSSMSAPGMSHMGQLHRASDLIGMNIKNAQNETVGEIKDVVLDLNSGHVAYTVVSADRFLDTRNELVAIPPSLFTFGADSRTVSLNANRNVLMSAPRFQSSNWNQVSNEQFVSRVYRHYGQQPYWQAQGFRQGTQFREPSGAEFEQQYEQNYQRQEIQQKQQFEQDSQFEQGDSSIQQGQDISEPSGAETRDLELQQQDSAPALGEPSATEPQADIAPDVDSQQSLQQEQSLQQGVNEPAGTELQQQEPERAISDPSGAELLEAEAAAEQESTSVESESETQVGVPSAGLEAETSAQVEEPAGAQAADTTLETTTETQQVDEAAGAAATAGQTQQLEQQIRSSLKGASEGQNVQVTSESGKIVLRGTVKSETEKEQIEQQVQDVILDNQIQVESSSDSIAPPQP